MILDRWHTRTPIPCSLQGASPTSSGWPFDCDGDGDVDGDRDDDSDGDGDGDGDVDGDGDDDSDGDGDGINSIDQVVPSENQFNQPRLSILKWVMIEKYWAF